jgi:hypothetical protein
MFSDFILKLTALEYYLKLKKKLTNIKLVIFERLWKNTRTYKNS